MKAGTCRVQAPAKINLFLRVLHRRPDGFREIETLFQTISLSDEVEVSIKPRSAGPDRRRGIGQTASAVTLDVVGPDLGPVRDNLAHRAAVRFLEAAGWESTVHIRLVKRIPAGAGLGGGSSDAAAVLRCLRELADPTGGVDIAALAAGLGSDVPFFLCGSPLALGRGRGEVLAPLEALPASPLVLALPGVHVSTAQAYRALGTSRGGAEVDPHGGPRGLDVGPDLLSGGWVRLADLAENDFEPVVCGDHEAVRASLDGLRAEGAIFALVSGSGSASFGLFDEIERARGAAERLTADLGWPFVVARTRHDVPGVSQGDLVKTPG